MRATLIHGAGDIRIEQVPDPVIKTPTDALVRITSACICGSDLHPYGSMPASDGPARIGHEFIGVVEDTGSEVSTVKKGDLVVAPFAYSDGTCQFCQSGLQTSCEHGGFWARDGVDGGQGEAARIPLADGTLVKLPVEPDSDLIPDLLTLSDVYGTGWHAAVRAGITPGNSVTAVSIGLSGCPQGFGGCLQNRQYLWNGPSGGGYQVSTIPAHDEGYVTTSIGGTARFDSEHFYFRYLTDLIPETGFSRGSATATTKDHVNSVAGWTQAWTLALRKAP